MPDSDDLNGSERLGWDLSDSEPPEGRFGWVNREVGQVGDSEPSAVAVGLLLTGVVWMLFFGIAALDWGLWPQATVFADPGVLDLGVNWTGLAVYAALAALGLTPLTVGMSFVFGVGPLARPVGESESTTGRPRRAALAVSIEVLLVIAILAVAAVVVRTVLHEGASFTSSVSNAPGP